MNSRLPLFPLNSIIFPGGVLPLRIFETRYLQMVKECVRQQSEFVICAIQDGHEVGRAAKPANVGTTCEIVDWETLPDGLLGITALGKTRVQISNISVQENQLLTSDVVVLDEENDQLLPDKFSEWANLIAIIIQQLGEPFSSQQQDLQSALWVSSRLTEYLPFELGQKQRILELDHPLIRLDYLQDMLNDIEYYYSQGNFNR